MLNNGGGVLRKGTDEAEKQADQRGREIVPRMVLTSVRNTVNLRRIAQELAGVLDSGRTTRRRDAVFPVVSWWRRVPAETRSQLDRVKLNAPSEGCGEVSSWRANES